MRVPSYKQKRRFREIRENGKKGTKENLSTKQNGSEWRKRSNKEYVYVQNEKLSDTMRNYISHSTDTWSK